MSITLYLTMVVGCFLFGILLLFVGRYISPKYPLHRGMCEGAGWGYLVAGNFLVWFIEVQP